MYPNAVGSTKKERKKKEPLKTTCLVFYKRRPPPPPSTEVRTIIIIIIIGAAYAFGAVPSIIIHAPLSSCTLFSPLEVRSLQISYRTNSHRNVTSAEITSVFFVVRPRVRYVTFQKKKIKDGADSATPRV